MPPAWGWWPGVSSCFFFATPYARAPPALRAPPSRREAWFLPLATLFIENFSTLKSRSFPCKITPPRFKCLPPGGRWHAQRAGGSPHVGPDHGAASSLPATIPCPFPCRIAPPPFECLPRGGRWHAQRDERSPHVGPDFEALMYRPATAFCVRVVAGCLVVLLLQRPTLGLPLPSGHPPPRGRLDSCSSPFPRWNVPLPHRSPFPYKNAASTFECLPRGGRWHAQRDERSPHVGPDFEALMYRPATAFCVRVVAGCLVVLLFCNALRPGSPCPYGHPPP